MTDLMIRAEDVEEGVLAAVDAEFHQDFGPEAGWQRWQRWQREQYLAAVDKVHRQFAGAES